jgi:hypothetical protein
MGQALPAHPRVPGITPLILPAILRGRDLMCGAACALNLGRGSDDSPMGCGFFAHEFPGESHMPNIELQNSVRISRTYPASTGSSDRFDFSQLTSIALFSGLGLLVSLVAILSGVQGEWY